MKTINNFALKAMQKLKSMLQDLVDPLEIQVRAGLGKTKLDYSKSCLDLYF